MVRTRPTPDILKISLKDKKTLDEMRLSIEVGINECGRYDLSRLDLIIFYDYLKDVSNPHGYGFIKPVILKRYSIFYGTKEKPELKSDEWSDWWIVKFVPYSQEMAVKDFPSPYETREEALAGAIEYLGKKGYAAKSIDLIGMINKF